jgi:basic membrane lipoprotein Med (substrate-binding protein (PBP1-ABC) superfamily)
LLAFESGGVVLVHRVPMVIGSLVVAAVAAAGVTAGLLIAGAGAGGRALPPVRARVYENVDACLLTGPQGVSDPAAAQAWAGMEDASKATSARVSYLAVTGPATEANASTYLGSLLVRGCRVIVASGAPESAAVLAQARQSPRVRFVVAGNASGPANVTAVVFPTNGMRAAMAAAVESGIRSAGG